MDDVIRKYVERALELAEQRDDSLSDEDLAQIARDLGLSDEDLERVEQSVTDHLARGHGYAQHQLWDDAIREFEEAATLAPSRIAVKLALAETFASRWASTDFNDDKVRADQLARAVLQTDPTNSQAFDVLARLNPERTGASSAQPGSSRTLMVLTGGVVVAILMSGGVGFFLMRPTDPPKPAPIVRSTPVETPAAVEQLERFESSEVELPVEFTAYEGMTFRTRKSHLASYPDRAFYTLWGDIEVTGDLEVTRIDLNVKLVDDAGKVLKAHNREAWATHEAKLHKGDHAVFSMLVDGDRTATKALVAVGIAEKVSAKGPYAEARVVEPKWEITPPDHLKLEIRERRAVFSSSGLMEDKGFFKAEWEFRNVGDVPIAALTYQLEMYDAHDTLIESKRRLATFSSNPPIEPGEVLLESTVSMIPSSYARYQIVITEIE